MQLVGLLELPPVLGRSDGPGLALSDGPVLGLWDGPVLGPLDGLSHGAPRVALHLAVSEGDSELIHDPGATTASGGGGEPSWAAAGA